MNNKNFPDAHSLGACHFRVDQYFQKRFFANNEEYIYKTI